MISLVVVLTAAAIYVLDASIQAENEVSSRFEPTRFEPSLPLESGVFKRGPGDIDYETMTVENPNRKSLTEYYDNRAYAGAPPVIPHPLLSEQGIGDQSCLQCHKNGGYVEEFKKFAPITPHPELINCKQCHVPVKTERLFAATQWTKSQHPELGRAALPGSPPPTPHDLQMRENCLACHAGPAAPREILVSHPERVNCRQCHTTAVNKFRFIQWDSLPATTQKPLIEWIKLSQ
ncbi:MAG: cytochrome c3 family protein [Cytophagales bacterium]|nr:cytochrome c3 family protein [Cytophagales bacterium]